MSEGGSVAEEVIEAPAVVSLERIQESIVDPGHYQVDELVPQERVQQGTVGQVLDEGSVVPLERVSQRIMVSARTSATTCCSTSCSRSCPPRATGSSRTCF